MARPSKPTALILQEGKSRYSKATIKFRQEGEKAMMTGGTIHESAQVKADHTAHIEYLRLKRLFTDKDYVDALDQSVINRYCLEVAGLARMQAMLDKLNTDLLQTEAMEARLKIYEMINRTNAAMHRSKEMLLKFEDRLFLNPATRIRAVPKTPAQDEADLSPMGRLLASKRPD